MAKNICLKCNKDLVYHYKGRRSVLCAQCFLDAIIEFLSEPCYGDNGYCKVCGEQITYVDPHWSHIKGRDLHIPKPIKSWAQIEGYKLIAWLKGK